VTCEKDENAGELRTSFDVRYVNPTIALFARHFRNWVRTACVDSSLTPLGIAATAQRVTRFKALGCEQICIPAFFRWSGFSPKRVFGIRLIY